MKLVLLAVIGVVLLADDVIGDVQCGNDKFCRVGFRPFKANQRGNEYQKERVRIQKLAIFAENNIVGMQKEFQEVAEMIQLQSELCRDDTVGFMLDQNVTNYQISCVWTGASQFGQCRAVPPKYMNQIYGYIEGKEWHDRVTKVHAAIGCNLLYHAISDSNSNTRPISIKFNEKHAESIKRASEEASRNATTTTKSTVSRKPHPSFEMDSAHELFICNERCVQGGIGYVASILIMLTLAISFFKNCVHGVE